MLAFPSILRLDAGQRSAKCPQVEPLRALRLLPTEWGRFSASYVHLKTVGRGEIEAAQGFESDIEW